MAEPNPEVNYSYYNTSYYAYASGFMYEQGPQQNNGNLSGLDDTVDLNHYNSGITPANYTAPHQATYDAESEVRRTESESASDLEAHVSPDSWSSKGSGATSLPQADPATRVKEDQGNNAISRSPDGNNHVSSSLLGETVTVTTESNVLHVPPNAPAKSSTKGKVRAAFSEMQMNALVQRFTVQRYLTPAEMKDLAEMIGLSYKQVKTWFQNRRMKLRRHQKDNTWLCERSNIRNGPIHGTMYNNNIPQNVPPFQGETQPQFREHYNHHVMPTPFREPPLQNMNFCLAAMGNTAGSSGYASWSSNTSQNAVPTRPQMDGWSIPPGVGHYEYNPNAFNPPPANNTFYDTGFRGQNIEPVNSCCFVNTGIVHNASQ
ncbi:Homeobox protein NANOG Homeobox transcription factor Nanog [Channa argus]|uniref:Homeobox protein NANOG Homeobox transcription factor Nanog n=1 Tax=Channa argus TaxID=215402 RepID=A0A6G1QMI4_CHAAH|nr:Homeobox protein NANOG Homeobox transcription factor Nanog [Channa argus]